MANVYRMFMFIKKILSVVSPHYSFSLIYFSLSLLYSESFKMFYELQQKLIFSDKKGF
jgi:hypothetical protein